MGWIERKNAGPDEMSTFAATVRDRLRDDPMLIDQVDGLLRTNAVFCTKYSQLHKLNRRLKSTAITDFSRIFYSRQLDF